MQHVENKSMNCINLLKTAGLFFEIPLTWLFSPAYFTMQKKVNHSANAAIFHRRLRKAWLYTQEDYYQIDPLIKRLFHLAIRHAKMKEARNEKGLNRVLTFSHHLQSPDTQIKQRYKATVFGQIILIPSPAESELQRLCSPIFVF